MRIFVSHCDCHITGGIALKIGHNGGDIPRELLEVRSLKFNVLTSMARRKSSSLMKESTAMLFGNTVLIGPFIVVASGRERIPCFSNRNLLIRAERFLNQLRKATESLFSRRYFLLATRIAEKDKFGIRFLSRSVSKLIVCG